ncbi:MAG: hypothetical protein H0W99_06625 [Acidobacteria bacterium]|nr:hypothetical protein [Acidobacteriota bacterium]
MRCLARLSLSLILFIICAAGGRAQETKCALSLGQSPELRGLRLGMTVEQVKARFKIIETEEADAFGVAKLQLDPGHEGVKSEAVRDIAIELINERIVSIRLVYNPLDSPTNYREFTERLSKSLGLPQAWKSQANGQTVTGMMLQCAGFKISAALIGAKIPVVYLIGLEAEPTLTKRQEEREKRLRDFFRP